MARKQKSSRRQSAKQQGQGRFWLYTARVAIWVAALALLISVVIGTGYGLHRLLFTANPHFRLRHLETVTTGAISRDAVRRELHNLGLKPLHTNLYAIDIKSIRKALEERFVVDRVTVVRRLPSTLKVTLYERRPVARLKVRDAKLIDSEGWIIPALRSDRMPVLPEITGVYHAEKLEPGMRTRDEVLLAALRFLRLIAVRAEGRYYDVVVIQLDYTAPALNIYLNPRETFRRGARITMPIDKMDEAMRRLTAIVEDRIESGETTFMVDVTYETNVPVIP